MAMPGLHDVRLKAAALLTAAEGQPDGWLSAEAASSRPAVDPPSASDYWLHRLLQLSTQVPSLNLVNAWSADYPPNLRTVKGRPAILFVDGQLTDADRRAIAIVGAAGKGRPWRSKLTRSIAQELGEHGPHSRVGPSAWDRLGSTRRSVDRWREDRGSNGHRYGRYFPPENAALSDRIRNHGALISQFPPGFGPTKTSFPARNAVIAGMSLGSLIITANERSGTRIEINCTARARTSGPAMERAASSPRDGRISLPWIHLCASLTLSRRSSEQSVRTSPDEAVTH